MFEGMFYMFVEVSEHGMFRMEDQKETGPSLLSLLLPLCLFNSRQSGFWTGWQAPGLERVCVEDEAEAQKLAAGAARAAVTLSECRSHSEPESLTLLLHTEVSLSLFLGSARSLALSLSLSRARSVTPINIV